MRHSDYHAFLKSPSNLSSLKTILLWEKYTTKQSFNHCPKPRDCYCKRVLGVITVYKFSKHAAVN